MRRPPLLVYVEYRSRRPGIDLETFHEITGRKRGTWSDEHSEDELVCNIGRTWRLGPEPEYLTVYYTRAQGLDRLTDWERIFTSGAAAHLEAQTQAVARLDAASCLEPLAEPIAAERGIYYLEYFDIPKGSTREQVTALYEDRRRRSGFTLHLLADRIGKLGPDPRGLAMWGIPDYGALERLARELDGVEHPVALLAAGLYRDVGDEIL